MKVHYVNREDREDRNYLFRGAMAAMGFPPEDLVRVIAKNREDYPDRKLLCDAAYEDGFRGFFQRMKDRRYPGYGHLVSTWSNMRSWRIIAEGGEVALHMIDDYYIKQPKQSLELLIKPLYDLNLVQLAWHVRDDVFFLNQHKLNIPYKHVKEDISEKSPYFIKGAWHGCSDWAMVLSPKGASAILDYMDTQSPINAECVSTAMQHTYRDFPGIYSLKDQPRDVNGNKVLRTNQWVGHLVEYTEGPVSDLMGTHEIPDMVKGQDLSDDRMEE